MMIAPAVEMVPESELLSTDELYDRSTRGEGREEEGRRKQDKSQSKRERDVSDEKRRFKFTHVA